MYRYGPTVITNLCVRNFCADNNIPKIVPWLKAGPAPRVFLVIEMHNSPKSRLTINNIWSFILGFHDQTVAFLKRRFCMFIHNKFDRSMIKRWSDVYFDMIAFVSSTDAFTYNVFADILTVIRTSSLSILRNFCISVSFLAF